MRTGFLLAPAITSTAVRQQPPNRVGLTPPSGRRILLKTSAVTGFFVAAQHQLAAPGVQQRRRHHHVTVQTSQRTAINSDLGGPIDQVFTNQPSRLRCRIEPSPQAWLSTHKGNTTLPDCAAHSATPASGLGLCQHRSRLNHSILSSAVIVSSVKSPEDVETAALENCAGGGFSACISRLRISQSASFSEDWKWVKALANSQKQLEKI